MKRIMMTMAVAAMGMTAMMAQSHEVTTTDKNGNKVVYEISDAAATKGDTLSITTFDPQSVAKSDSINRASREENYELTKEDIRSIMREMDIDTDWVPTALGGMILGGIICVVLPIVIVAAVLLYRYYSRKKKYELAQKILESGRYSISYLPLVNDQDCLSCLHRSVRGSQRCEPTSFVLSPQGHYF